MRHLTFLVLVCTLSSCAQEEPTSATPANIVHPPLYPNFIEQAPFDDIGGLKGKHPAADQWVTHKFENERYVFCLDDLGGLGQARRCLLGWRYSNAISGWRHVVTVHTRGFSSADIVFQESGSLCVVLGKSNDRLKGENCIVVDLRVL